MNSSIYAQLKTLKNLKGPTLNVDVKITESLHTLLQIKHVNKCIYFKIF